MIIYGMHSVEHALRSGGVLEVCADSGRHDARIGRILALAQAALVPIRRVSKAELDAQSDGERHQGVTARIEKLSQFDERSLLTAVRASQKAPLLLVLDGVTDPHNLGACMRTAEAAGAMAVVAPKDRAAGLTPVARKAACGAAERLPFVTVTNLARFLAELTEAGIWIVGLAADTPLSIFQLKLTRPLALVLGGEGAGLRRLTRERCDQLASLPMRGAVESLNVSVATGICLYEVLRQRGS